MGGCIADPTCAHHADGRGNEAHDIVDRIARFKMVSRGGHDHGDRPHPREATFSGGPMARTGQAASSGAGDDITGWSSLRSAGVFAECRVGGMGGPWSARRIAGNQIKCRQQRIALDQPMQQQ